MACTVEGNQLYCTTADIHFGPGFDSYEDADAFLSWCYRIYGDPRQGKLDLDALKAQWEEGAVEAQTADRTPPALRHTPGPWVHDASFNVPVGPGDSPENPPKTWLTRTRGTGLEIIHCGTNRERILADTALIAAAPDMLAALEWVMRGVKSDDPDMWDAIESAIAKAKGGES